MSNFNTIKNSSRFSEYRFGVLGAVTDLNKPLKCVHILISTKDYRLLIDLLLQLIGLNDVTLSLLDELIGLISTDLLVGICHSIDNSMQQNTIRHLTSSSSSSSSFSMKDGNRNSNINDSNSYGNENNKNNNNNNNTSSDNMNYNGNGMNDTSLYENNKIDDNIDINEYWKVGEIEEKDQERGKEKEKEKKNEIEIESIQKGMKEDIEKKMKMKLNIPMTLEFAKNALDSHSFNSSDSNSNSNSNSSGLSLRQKIHFEIREETCFLLQIFRLLINLCDIWQFREFNEKDSSNAISNSTTKSLNIRDLIRDKTSILVTTIAHASYNDELVCSILNVATNFTAESYEQMENIENCSKAALIVLKSTNSSVCTDGMINNLRKRITFICISCLACTCLSVQRQILNINELLTVLPGNPCDNSTIISFIKKILETGCYYTLLNSNSNLNNKNSGSSSSSTLLNKDLVNLNNNNGISPKGMFYIPSGLQLDRAMEMLGNVLSSAPPVIIPSSNVVFTMTRSNNSNNDHHNLLNIIDVIEPLLLERLNNDIILPIGMREKCFYNIALKLGQIQPNTYYIRSLMESESCFSNLFNIETIGVLLNISQSREGKNFSCEIIIKILKDAMKNSTVEACIIIKILFSYPSQYPSIRGYSGPFCPFTTEQSTELFNILINDVNGCLRSFYDFNPLIPLFSISLIVKNVKLMELITTKVPLNNQRTLPLDYTRLIVVWGELYLTSNLLFLQLFYTMGETVVQRMVTERINPRMKETFEDFLGKFKSIILSQVDGGGLLKWSKFKQYASKSLKNKKSVLQIVTSL